MAAGVAVLLVGLAGLLLPILPGWLLIFVGLAMLGVRIPYADRLLAHAKARLARGRTPSPTPRAAPPDDRRRSP
jgi:hypothetical protein